MIDLAEREHLPDAKIGYLWGRLASDYVGLADFARAEDAYFRSLRLLRNAPEAQKSYATLLDNLGVLYFAFDRRAEAEPYLKRSFAERRKQGDIVALGISQVHLANLLTQTTNSNNLRISQQRPRRISQLLATQVEQVLSARWSH
jgi:tetratricopeptide (TPR) repeat protein